MANITATKNGNWSDVTVWDLGRTPADGDVVLAQTYAITLDVDFAQPNTLLKATTGYYQFTGTGTRNITANANAGTHTSQGLIRITNGGTLAFTGEVKGGSGSSAYGITNANNIGSVVVTTTRGGGGAASHGVYLFGAGDFTAQTAVGGAATNSCGVSYNGSGVVTIGTATGGTNGSNTDGVNVDGAGGTAIVTTATGGTSTAAHGVRASGAGKIVAVGTAIGGNGNVAFGVSNGSGNGTIVRVGTAVGSGPGSFSNPGVNGYAAISTTLTTVEHAVSGAYGQAPLAGCVCLLNTGANTVTFREAPNGDEQVMILPDTLDWPATGDVRYGTTFGNGTYTGSAHIPAPGSVALGAPVDGTTGTAVLTASAIRGELSVELGRVDVTVSTRAAAGDEMGLADGAITASTYDGSTAYPLTSPDVGTTRVARTGADSDTLETLSDALDGLAVALAQAEVTVVSAVDGGTLTIYQAVTFAAVIGGLAIPAGWTAVYWTVKRSVMQGDDAAVVQVRVSSPAGGSDGLLRLNGVAATAAQGALTVDQTGGTVTLALMDEAADDLDLATGLIWSLKALNADGSSALLTVGTLNVLGQATLTV